MIPAQVAAFIFIILAFICFMFSVFFRSDAYSKYKKFYIATSAVYLSGTVLVFLICRHINEVPWIAALISEIFMSAVFGISVFALTYVGKKADAFKSEAENGN